jgi:RNA polymerase sigma-70 factor (ECF subfamily)
MQDLFINLSRSSGFDNSNHPEAYAQRAARHLAFNWLRAQKRRPDTKALPDAVPVSNPSPLSHLVGKERLEMIRDALLDVPDAQREIIVLRFIQQYPYQAIAEQMQCTAHQARALCHKGIESLRKLLHPDSKAEVPYVKP